MENAVGKDDKPIDRWLGLAGIAIGIVFYLLPKSPRVVVSSVIILFCLLIHPIWNFWWIEAKRWRKLTATFVFVCVLIWLGRSSWPSESGSLFQVAQHHILAFWRWLAGPHGRWFDKAIGAAYALAGVIVLLLLGTVANAMKLKKGAKGQKGFLDYKLDAETAMWAMPAVLEKLTRIMTEVTPALDKHTAALQRTRSTAEQLGVSKGAASSLDRYSVRVDRIRVRFVRTGGLLSEGLTGWSKWIGSQQPSRATFGSFPDVLRHFTDTLSVTNNQLTVYITTMSSIRGVSSVLDAAVDRHVESWRFIAITNQMIHQACTETLKIFDSLT